MSTYRSPMGKALIGSALLHAILIPLTCAPPTSAAPAREANQLVFIDVAPAKEAPALPPSEPPPPPTEAPKSAALAPKSAPPPAPPAPPAGAVPVLTAPREGLSAAGEIASGNAMELRGGAVSAVGTATAAPTVMPPPAAEPKAPPSPEKLSLARDYLARFRVELQRRQRFPEAAQRLGLYGVTTLSLTIDGHGRLVDVAVVQSSGHEILDQSALATARSLSGLPRPADLGDAPLRTTARLRFEQPEEG